MSYGDQPAADPSALVTERQAYDRISHMTGDLNVRADSDAWTRTSASNPLVQVGRHRISSSDAPWRLPRNTLSSVATQQHGADVRVGGVTGLTPP